MARRGAVGSDMVGQGSVRFGRHGKVRWGKVSLGEAGFVSVRCGRLGLVRSVEEGWVVVRLDVARQAWCGKSMERYGEASSGRVW